MISVSCTDFRSDSDEYSGNSKNGGVNPNYLLYTLEVQVDGEDINRSCFYEIERSYTSLVLFDKNLRKIFPNSRSSLPNLPLQDSVVTFPVSGPSMTAGRSMSTSSGSSAGSNSASGRVPGADLNTLSTKANDLSNYFGDLLKLPEIITSDLLYCFLDGESKDGKKFDPFSVNEACNSVDILLSNKSLNKKTVLKCHTVTLTAEPSQCVCWIFYTKKHDIGFSVALNGKEGVKYERVNSHEKTIKGMFQVPEKVTSTNEIKISFDNSYSKLRAKDLRYSVGVFSKEEWNMAHESANKANEAKKEYALHRAIVESALRGLAKSITGQVHADLRSGGSGHSLAALMTSAKDKEELQRILDEKSSLMRAYEDTLIVLQKEKQTAAEALLELENMKCAKDTLEDELLAANAEIELFKEKIESAQLNLQANQESLMEALGHSKSSEEVELMLTRALETSKEELKEARRDLEESRLAHNALDKKFTQAVSERKQLKQYGKTAKVELERLNLENKALEVDLESSTRSLADATDKLEEAHEEILRLQGAYAMSTEKIKSLEATIAAQTTGAAVEGQVPSEDRNKSSKPSIEFATGQTADRNTQPGAQKRQGHLESEMERVSEDVNASRLSIDEGWEQMGGGDDFGESESRASVGADDQSLQYDSGVHKSEHSSYRDDSHDDEEKVCQDGKWRYIPPPRLVTASGFFGF